MLLPLGACANTPWASQLQQSLAADPQLQGNSIDPSPAVEPSPDQTEAQLPANFPAEIPRYPNAELVGVTTADQTGVAIGTNPKTQTRWQTADSASQVRQFYQEKFQTGGWQMSPDQLPAQSPEQSPDSQDQPLQATRDGLLVSVATPTGTGKTEFSIDYQFGEATSSASPSLSASPSASPSVTDHTNASVPKPGDPGFIGPIWTGGTTAQSSPASSPSSSSHTTDTFADLNQAPTELQPYITDLAKLGALSPQSSSSNTSSVSGDFKPNAEISRRDYARWLVAANNQIYANQAARKIRLAAATDQPVFQDVPASDPDFGAIQGLANAGLIPSPLSGDSTTVTFRPDAPLTREELILWKVPVDLRQALPNASIDTIQQTWGFQDAAKIDPKAMRAVLADYQNGDLSNIRRAFGYTTLFQPKKAVSRAEAAAVLWQFGSQGNNLSAKDAMQMGTQVGK